MDLSKNISKAASFLAKKNGILVFTGAGISVESGIPPFRGVDGLWEKYDPNFIEISYFYRNPKESWRQIKELFYDNWGEAKPNPAHYAVAELQKHGFVHTIITQNIDCLHQRAGAGNVVEFHGTLDRLVCTGCSFSVSPEKSFLEMEIPSCPHCGSLLKPDFVFYGEAIPEEASDRSFDAVREVSSVLIIGTSGEVMPACMIPEQAQRNGAKVIEINPVPSSFTEKGVTDIFLEGKAGEVLPKLTEEILKCRS